MLKNLLTILFLTHNLIICQTNGYNPNDFASFDTNDTNNLDGLRDYLGFIAWNGLGDTPTFQQLYPIGTLQYQNIIQLINSESFPYESTATPMGNPCN